MFKGFRPLQPVGIPDRLQRLGKGFVGVAPAAPFLKVMVETPSPPALARAHWKGNEPAGVFLPAWPPFLERSSLVGLFARFSRRWTNDRTTSD